MFQKGDSFFWPIRWTQIHPAIDGTALRGSGESLQDV
jgi:hypothetical protein